MCSLDITFLERASDVLLDSDKPSCLVCRYMKDSWSSEASSAYISVVVPETVVLNRLASEGGGSVGCALPFDRSETWFGAPKE